jgi:hypothetical protein
MTLELTSAEKVVLLDSIETRQIRVQQLIHDFKNDPYFIEADGRNKMVEYYEEDLTLLGKLLERLQTIEYGK